MRKYFFKMVLCNFYFQPNCKVTAMKCFLLELRVLLHESRNMDINETVQNLIIVANSSLSSKGVSYLEVTQSHIQCFWHHCGKLLMDKQILLKGTWVTAFKSNGVASESDNIAGMHTIQNYSCVYLVNKHLLNNVRQCVLMPGPSGEPNRLFTSSCLSSGAPDRQESTDIIKYSSSSHLLSYHGGPDTILQSITGKLT